MNSETKAFIDNLNWKEKKEVYLYLKAEQVKEDVRNVIEEDCNYSGKLSIEEQDKISSRVAYEYVYEDKGDPDLSYWQSLDCLIEKELPKIRDERFRDFLNGKRDDYELL